MAENIELHKSKLKFFMQKFCAIIRTMESTNKELSIAIRGYGLFAAVGIWTFFYNSKKSIINVSQQVQVFFQYSAKYICLVLLGLFVLFFPFCTN